MSDTLRTFFAVPLSAELRGALHELQRELEARARRARAAVRWLPAADLHVTIRFNGWTPVDAVPDLERVSAEEAARTAAYRVERGQLTAFGSVRRARVIVTEFVDPEAILGKLAERLERRCRELGLEPEERPFRAHVTLARLREPARVTSWLEERELSFPDSSLSELVFFRSDLLPTGAVYTSLARSRFGASG